MLHNNIIPIESELDKIDAYAQDCEEANCEENDYTVYSYEELEYEYGLAKENVAKKLSFLENQVNPIIELCCYIRILIFFTEDCRSQHDKLNTDSVGRI